MSGKLSIVCSLSDAELRTREATLLAQFRAEATMCEEFDDGYIFRLPGDEKHLELVLALMIGAGMLSLSDFQPAFPRQIKDRSASKLADLPARRNFLTPFKRLRGDPPGIVSSRDSHPPQSSASAVKPIIGILLDTTSSGINPICDPSRNRTNRESSGRKRSAPNLFQSRKRVIEAEYLR